jgi:beta-lactamase class A
VQRIGNFRRSERRPSRISSVVAALVCTALFAIRSTSGANHAEDRIAAINARVGGRIGVAALDTGTGQHIEYKANERFPMCSTFKVLAAAAVLKLVDEGKEHLDRMVAYGKEDILEYAPVTKEHLKEGRMTLANLCAAAIEKSDNTAGNLLLRTIGGPLGLTSFLRALGDKTTRLDRMEPDLNTAIPGDERDTTTPAAMRDDLVRLLTKDVLSPASRRQLETWLAGSKTGAQMIRAGVPATWRVGDKTGRGGNGATNDVAVLRPPNRPPIFLAIYSVGSAAAASERTATVAEVARVVAEAFQADGQKLP